MGEKPVDIKSIFADALEKETAEERAAYLDKACGNDANLRNKVEALLKAYEEADDVPEVPIIGPEITLDNSRLTEGPGTRIGRYKLLQMIGEGGFGVVYMAEQQKPISRRVALKIIKLGMDTKQVIARFEAERQALAMMEHPNIARVLDAGATDTGRPYFVMELVKGVPITEYCDKNNLDTQQRLGLFIDVCKAVQHAHQKGIIHRDIKPSNVMITLHDGTPVPKIIDFGIAKATQQRLTEKTLFTEYRQFIGTPAYMSPEQAEMSGLDVDTRTDIYSLGVLLYELLTGTTPFDADKLRSAAYDEMRRIIRETEPPRPSTRLSTLGDELNEVAKHRHAQPSELCRIVRGDLDWVVMKTLEKDRTRRYETANELAMDIERHLRDEPVVAGPPSTVYRLRKFVRRNRTGVLFVLVVVAALLIGLVLATIGFVQASRQRNLAEAQRRRAGANFQMAREAVDEMTLVAKQKLVDTVDMGQVRWELLEKAQVFYQQFLDENRDDPAVREEVGRAYRHIGEINYTLGHNEKGVQAYLKAMDVFVNLACSFPDRLDYKMEIAMAATGATDIVKGDPRAPEAENTVRTIIATLAKLAVQFPDECLYRKALLDICGILDKWFNQVITREAYEQAIALFEDLLPEYPACRYELAVALNELGYRDRAETFRQELLALLPNLPYESRRTYMPWTRGMMGLVDYNVRINTTGTYQLYVRRDAHDQQSDRFYVWIEQLSDGPGGTVADWYCCHVPPHDRDADFATFPWEGFGRFEKTGWFGPRSAAVWSIPAPGDYTITIAVGEDGIAIDTFVFQLASLSAPEGDGPEESEIADDMVFLETDGRVVVEAEHFASRTPFGRNWLVIPDEDAGDTEHLNFRGTGYIQALPDETAPREQWRIWARRGDAHMELGEWARAVADYSRTLELKSVNWEGWEGRSRAYAELGQHEKAAFDFARAIELNPDGVELWHKRGEYYAQKDQWKEAVAAYSKAIELKPDDGGSWAERGRIYLKLGQWQKMAADYSRAIELSPKNWWYRHERGFAYMQLGQWENVIADYTKAIEFKGDNLRNYQRRAEAYEELGQWDKAIADYSKAIELAGTGPADPERQLRLAQMYRSLGDVLKKTGRSKEAQDAYRKGQAIEEVVPEAER